MTRATETTSLLARSKGTERERFLNLSLVLSAIIADGVATNVMLPYLPVWTEEAYQDPLGSGLESGLIIGLFPVAVAFTSIFLGQLSDKFGRLRLLMLGLVSVAGFTVMFGLTRTFWVACAARLLTGLFDSTQSVAYAAIGDFAPPGPERAMAFAWSSVSFQVARILSSVIGG